VNATEIIENTSTPHPVSTCTPRYIRDNTPHDAVVVRMVDQEEFNNVRLYHEQERGRQWSERRTSENGYWQQGYAPPRGRRGGHLVLRRGQEVT
jgi:hypothetical protein